MPNKNPLIRRQQSRDWARQRALDSEWVKKTRQNQDAWRRTDRGRCSTALAGTKHRSRKGGYAEPIATVDTLVAALVSQNYCCKICGLPESASTNRLHLDHDHETGKFRGWLCWCCNRYLGRIHDDPTRLVEYLHGN